MLDDAKLSDMEQAAYRAEQFPGFNFHKLSQAVSELANEVRRLRHELADPRFMYANGRCPRQGITLRNAQIDALREEVKQLKEQLGEGR